MAIAFSIDSSQKKLPSDSHCDGAHALQQWTCGILERLEYHREASAETGVLSGQHIFSALLEM